MLFLCYYRPLPGTSPADVDDRLLADADAGAVLAPHILSWFRHAEPGSGVLVVEIDEIDTLQKALARFSDALEITAQPAVRVAYSQAVNEVRSRRAAEASAASGS